VLMLAKHVGLPGPTSPKGEQGAATFASSTGTGLWFMYLFNIGKPLEAEAYVPR
jgi:hypothetical protein